MMFLVGLLVCSDESDMRTTAPRLLYIYSLGNDSKTRPLFILLGNPLSSKEIMANWAKITDENLSYYVSYSWLWMDENLLTQYPCLTLVYFRKLGFIRTFFFQAWRGFLSCFYCKTWPRSLQKKIIFIYRQCQAHPTNKQSSIMLSRNLPKLDEIHHKHF